MSYKVIVRGKIFKTQAYYFMAADSCSAFGTVGGIAVMSVLGFSMLVCPMLEAFNLAA